MSGALGGAFTPPRGEGQSPRMSAGRVSGSSPNAKRPARIDPDLTPSGMVMDIAMASEAIYALQRQFKQMEASLINHADLLDRCRDRGDGLQVAINVNISS